MSGGEVAGMSLMWKIRLIKRVVFRLIGYGSELRRWDGNALASVAAFVHCSLAFEAIRFVEYGD